MEDNFAINYGNSICWELKKVYSHLP